MLFPESRHPEHSSSFSRPRRAARFTIAGVLLGTMALAAAGVTAGPQGATVTARPPLEAVPAAQVTRALRARLRKCDAKARARRLHGRGRQTFVQHCVASLPKATKGPAAQPRAPH